MKLPLHLPGEEVVVFDPDQLEAAIDKGPPVTKLTAYFDLCKTDPEAGTVRYVDVPKKYTWDAKTKSWKQRKRAMKGANTSLGEKSPTIGRIPVINLNPKQQDLFFLRMLLHHVPGCTSFEYLKTVNGHQFDTFREACLALGLLNDDREIDKVCFI